MLIKLYRPRQCFKCDNQIGPRRALMWCIIKDTRFPVYRRWSTYKECPDFINIMEVENNAG